MTPTPNQARRSIVILGGGFGGMYTARQLNALLAGRGDVEIVLVNRHNYFLMTPLLFEAGSGVLEPRHSVNPIRKLFKRRGSVARFVQAEVREVDFKRKVVLAAPPGDGEVYEIPYAHLVIALGGVTNTSIIPGAERAMMFKVLADAIFLRNHVIELFERADVEADVLRKKAMLTFVIVGAGLVGVELMGELTEFLTNLAKSYPRIDPAEMHLELLEGGPKVLPEMDRDLADYAVEVLHKRGVRVRTNCRVQKIDSQRVHMPEGESIEAATIVVATGVKTNPLLDCFALEKDKRGRLMTEPSMLCRGQQDVWALGDCAHIPDPEGKPYPQLAQHAMREARVLASNIAASIGAGSGKEIKAKLEPFVYHTMGTLAALGHYRGVARIKKIKLRGFFAWWVWRTYYLFQMPRWNRRLRIMLDWIVALLFKNDIAELDLFGDEHPMNQKCDIKVERSVPTERPV